MKTLAKLSTLAGSLLHRRPRTPSTARSSSPGPIFALATAFTWGLTACFLSWRGSWQGSATFMTISALMGLWEIRIAYDAPTLEVHGPNVLLIQGASQLVRLC